MSNFYFIVFIVYIFLMANCRVENDTDGIIYWGIVGILLFLIWILRAIENKK